MKAFGVDDPLCVSCLRMVKDNTQQVMCRPPDRSPFDVTPLNLRQAIQEWGTSRIATSSGVPFLLFAVTMVNGAYRCAWHLD